LVETRRAVRVSLMRNTIHLVTTEDALALKPVFEPHARRGFFRGSPWGRNLTPDEAADAIQAGKQLLDEKPRTVAEISRLLAARFPGRDGLSLAYAVRSQLPLVFVTPRGIWQARGPVALTTFEAWLGRSAGSAHPPDDLVLRYLGAFGPASPADFRAWSGLAMGEVFERLRPRLVTFRGERGGELFDLPKAPRPDPETDAPVRFLPDFDNILLGHADRTRIMPGGKHLGMFSSNGVTQGAVLVDGFVRAMWKPVRGSLAVTPFERALSRSERPAVEAEGMRLLQLLAPDEEHDVRFEAAKP
ncbi:MAG TPA: winged helix DNA-binding domain-containing protein, partial [Candidatus Udaeobacter sp.]|nr:winged helix DNA-binding domain-containing protein [Candidatus Udaeobacter sp.]